MTVSLSLSGRRAIVSGAAAGIGIVIAETLAQAGARVQVCDVDEAKVAEIERRGGPIGAITCDLADAADAERFFRKAVERLGGLDILVNNAGIAGPIEPADTMSLEGWNRTLAIDLTSHFILARLAAPYMKKAGGGAIVNISSTAGMVGNARRAPYNAAKWGVIGLTKSLAKDFGPSKIRVNCISPGFVESDRMVHVLGEKAKRDNITPEEARARFLALSSMNTPVYKEDIAAMTLFLVSDAGARMSGHNYVVDSDMM